MEFKFNSAVFKNTPEDQQRLYGDKYDPNKDYPVYTGVVNVPAKELQAFVDYLHWALRTELKTDSYLNDQVIPIRIAGWQKSPEGKKRFLSLSYSPDYKTMMAAKDAREAAEISAHQDSLNDAAASLAKGTAGTVITPEVLPSDPEDVF